MKVMILADEYYPYIILRRKLTDYGEKEVDIPEELVVRWERASDEFDAVMEALRPYYYNVPGEGK